MSPLLATLIVWDASPKATLISFVKAVKARDAAAAARRVVDGKPQSIALRAGMPSLQVKLGEERIEGDSASIDVDAIVVVEGHLLPAVHETVEFRRVEGDWRIVPIPRSDFSKPRGPDYVPHVVARWARLVTDSELMAEAQGAAVRSRGLTNSKNIAVAAIMYSADHDDRLPRATNFRPSIAPYLRKILGPHPTSSDPFVVPGAPKGTTFFLDPRLSGRSLTSIDRISEVAMIVMGKGGRATFPYLGQTIIGFADGHVRRVNPEAAFKARTIKLD